MHLQMVHLEEGNSEEWEDTSVIIDWYSAMMEKEKGNKVVAEEGRDTSESDSRLESSESGEESAPGMVAKEAELHLEMEMCAWEEGQVKEESRPTVTKTCMMFELELIPYSASRAARNKQRRGGGSRRNDSLKGMWGWMKKWVKTRESGWERALESVKRSLQGTQSGADAIPACNKVEVVSAVPDHYFHHDQLFMCEYL